MSKRSRKGDSATESPVADLGLLWETAWRLEQDNEKEEKKLVESHREWKQGCEEDSSQTRFFHCIPSQSGPEQPSSDQGFLSIMS